MPSLTSLLRRAPRACLVAILISGLAPTLGCGAGAQRVPPAATGAEVRGEPPSKDAVWVRFEPESPSQRWSLIGGDDKPLCELPCARWIAASDTPSLEYAKPGDLRVVRVGLPVDLGAPGTTSIVTPRLAHGMGHESTWLLVGGTVVALSGLLVFAFTDDRSNTGTSDAVSIGVSLGILGAGLTGVVIALAMRAERHPDDVVVRSASLAPPSRFAFGPGYVEAAASSGPRIVLTPLGATGSF
jgi:hypothetical protein